MNNRVTWVDNSKAFACFLVVLGHLLMSLRPIDKNSTITEFIIWFIYLFHMPLFMCLSGYIYKRFSNINTIKDYKKFEIKKIINLIVPYLTFYSITMTFNMLFSNSVNNPKGIKEWLGIFNNPISPYWFIYALLSIFIFVPLLEKMFKDKKNVLLLFLILNITRMFFSTKIYFIDAIMSNGIYFYLGCFINDRTIKKSILFILIVLYLFISLPIYMYVYGKCEIIYNFLYLLMGLLGTTLIIEMFKVTKNSKILDTFKNYTFQIFLMHTIFAAGIRIIMYKLGVSNYSVHFIIGILASIYIPVLISIISNKIRFTNFFFFPLKTIEEYKKGRLICQKKKN